MLYLQWYNNALIIYGDARITDALAHLNKEYKTWLESTIMDETDRLLRAIFDSKSRSAFPHTTGKLSALRCFAYS